MDYLIFLSFFTTLAEVIVFSFNRTNMELKLVVNWWPVVNFADWRLH